MRLTVQEKVFLEALLRIHLESTMKKKDYSNMLKLSKLTQKESIKLEWDVWNKIDDELRSKK